MAMGWACGNLSSSGSRRSGVGIVIPLKNGLSLKICLCFCNKSPANESESCQLASTVRNISSIVRNILHNFKSLLHTYFDSFVLHRGLEQKRLRDSAGMLRKLGQII